MLRKLASVTALVFAGSLALAGTALAAPYDPATVGAARGAGGTYEIGGTGFGDTQADQYITATVLSSSGETTTYRFSLDENGEFAGSIPADECSATITIVGYPSGESRTAVVDGVECNDPGDNGAPTHPSTPSHPTGSAGVGGTGGSSGGSSYNGGGYSTDSYSSGSGQGAYSNGYANTGGWSSGSGLANTGANIAAPIAIGLGTLVLGLGLLFFGTRGIVRRKGLNGR